MSPHDYEPVEMRKELRHLVVDGEPSEAHRAAALESLDEAIASEGTSTDQVVPIDRKHTNSWRLRVGAVAAAAVALAVIGGGILATNQPLTATGLNEVVHVIEPIPPEDFSGASLERVRHEVYFRAFRFRDDRQIIGTQHADIVERMNGDGLVERVTTWHEPVAEDPAEQAELAKRFAEQPPTGLGVETFVYSMGPQHEYLPETAEGWDEKLQKMYKVSSFRNPAVDDDPPAPYRYYAHNNVLSVYWSEIPTAPQRAAMVNFLASLPGLEVDRQQDRITVTVEYQDMCCLRREIAVFDNSGWLIEEQNIIVDGIPEEGVPAGHSWSMTMTPWYEIDED